VARGSTRPAGHGGITDRTREKNRSAADRLFAELDNRAVDGSSCPWIAQVHGVHMIGSDAWVQVGSASEPFCSVMLHLSPRATADHALAALQAWSGDPETERSSVVHIA
jgi:hypothetical protein